MKLFTIYSQRLSQLKDHFLATIQDDYEVIMIPADKHLQQLNDKQQWKYCVGREKLDILNDIVRTHCGETVIFADIDIQFFRPTKADLLQTMRCYDIVFQKEKSSLYEAIGSERSPANLNTGFMCFHCHPIVQELFQQAREWHRRNGQSSQHIINRLLLRGQPAGIRFGLLDARYWTYSQGGLDNLPKHVFLHHANCVIEAEKKWEQMLAVRKAVIENKTIPRKIERLYCFLKKILRQICRSVRNGIKISLWLVLWQFSALKIWRIIKEKPAPLLSMNEMSAIADEIVKQCPCRLLVFGVGWDSMVWMKLNRKGTTLFLENNEEWFDRIRYVNPELNGYLVAYQTKLAEWQKWIANADQLRMVLPPEVVGQQWDIILVDAPLGVEAPDAPGRMQSIYMAAQLIKKGGVVFVHDCDREVERICSDRYLGANHLEFEVFGSALLRKFRCKTSPDFSGNNLLACDGSR
jgi:glucuronoxylan 4-O-methyltransferase